ncbi:aspartate aminotransferase family protein [Curvibacter sp. APW13]|uniref:pyridoxal phosphate-dependent decarboxylase family protein n=1 Tax=Curvibacter sp. APW13 TaxID=3077236 RepID=UPI0028DEE10A|nr:aspartate aminotransferase family protein [Curvibacter sp. APW13]MDT8989621.1 aspartate aminotransferase family protein [Curvibacter sp. APW13]
MKSKHSTALPRKGRATADVLADLHTYGADDPDYKHGRLWSLVYYLDEDYADFQAQAYQAFSSANGLNPTAFKSLKQFETEIIAGVSEMLHGTPEVCGVVTSGGTESCLLAVKTYRDMARARGVKQPEMVLPVTAHVAWFKASEYFDVKVHLLPLDENLRADVRKLPGLINRNTVMILGSAPEYPHGTIDPIEAFGAIAVKRGVPLHVDACVGGFILPFMEMNGRTLPLWDYRVPGVTSISADIHKYGFASKGASTITYRNLDYLKHQMFVQQDWPGGVFASPALLGTRPGGAYAAAWAAMQHFGQSGYRDLAKRTMKAFDTMKKGIEAIPDLYVMGSPSGPLLAYGSCNPDVNIYAVGDQMDAKGWKVNRLQNPDGLHAMITAGHLEVVNDYLRDLREAVATVKAHPELAQSGSAATYGLMSHLPLRGMVRQKVLDMFAQMYRAGGQDMDLHASATPATGWVGRAQALAEKAAHWYVERAQRRATLR